MVIQYLGGGLGNQIRQYVFARYFERRHQGIKCYFDDVTFFVLKADHNVFKLESVFGTKLNLLSEYFDEKIWAHIVANRKQDIILPQTLLDMGEDIVLFEGRVHESQIQNQARFSGKIIRASGKHLGFHPEYTDLPYKNIYYHAEWASRKWFDAYAEENRQELQFPILTDKQNWDYEEQINSSYSVGIHIRRGDFQAVGWDLPAGAYKPACQKVVEEHPNAHFFIFSDDLDWCHAHEKELGFDLARQTTYIFGNTGEKSYIDMQLLSMCRGIIRNGESSFSQVAGWLDRNLEFEIKIKPEAGYPYKVVAI